MPFFGNAWHQRGVPPSSEDIAATWGPFLRHCIDLFGPDRCMFESNFPVDRRSTSYVVEWNAYKRLTADLSPGERGALFSGTARRVYGLPTP
jgi:predicted TIM-barrel fold metal-dependent hydrolase